MISYFNKLKKDVLDSIYINKLFLVFLLIAFILGVILAFICFFNFKNVITIKNLTDKLLLNYFKCNYSLFKFFILKLLLISSLIVFVIIICANKISKYLMCFISLYYSYCLIFNLCVISLIFGFFGFIFALTIVFLLGLIYFLLVIVLMLLCLNKNNYCCNYFFNLRNILNYILIIYGLIFIILILEIIFIPLMSNTFIII